MADVMGVAGDRLKSFIERIERLEEEKRALAEDIKEVFSEAKGTGFDVKIMRQLLKIRRQDTDDLAEQETLLDVYKRAIGMLPSFEDEYRHVAVPAGPPLSVEEAKMAIAIGEPVTVEDGVALTSVAHPLRYPAPPFCDLCHCGRGMHYEGCIADDDGGEPSDASLDTVEIELPEQTR